MKVVVSFLWIVLICEFVTYFLAPTTQPFLLLAKCEQQHEHQQQLQRQDGIQNNNVTTIAMKVVANETLVDQQLAAFDVDAMINKVTEVELPNHFHQLSQDRKVFELKQFDESSEQIWSERVILEILYHSLQGDKWAQSTNWLDESISICLWKGITCQLPEAYYLILDSEGKYQSSSENGINHILSSSSAVDLSGTAQSADKKKEEGEDDLVHIRDYANYFTPEKGAVVTKIELVSNNLSGTLPSELHMLPYLRLLNLEKNQIKGTLPTTFGLFRKMRFLELGYNAISGTIPQELANSTFLDELLLNNNNLTGTIPSLLTLLPRLLVLDLGYNNLEGKIPPTLGCMNLLEILYFENNRLVGRIPPQIEGMGKLRMIDLSNNLLHGIIPSEIGMLLALENFMADNNRLTGSLPRQLFRLDELECINLTSNLLDGTLPLFTNPKSDTDSYSEEDDEDFDEYEDLEEVELSPKLEKLLLGNNYFTGSIAPKLGTLVSLRELDLSHNLFTGTIPAILADSKELRWLDLSSNVLTGYIPDELANLIFLYYLNMTDNELIGIVPKSLCEKLWLNSGHVAMFGCDALLCPPGKWHPLGMANEYGGCGRCSPNIDSDFLGQVSCIGGGDNENDSNGFLYGDLDGDDELSQREVLHLLYLYTNGKVWGEKWKDWKNFRKVECELTGVLCGSEGQITEIYLKGANLCGGCELNDARCCRGMPSELSLLSSLEMLDLSSSSSLAGSIPESLGELEELKVLDLTECHSLIGTIPTELGKCISLRILSLSKTLTLSGTIPASFGNLRQLAELDLSANKLSGSLPHSIGQLRNLIKLDASLNDITGYIPRSFGNLDRLQHLLLRGNKLGGSLPEAIGSCSSLKIIDLTYNNHSGLIPSSLGSIGSLEELYLAANSFTGTIPRELGRLSSMASLDLSSNAISGTIPSDLGFLSLLTRLDLSSNAISGEIPEEIGLLRNLSLLDLSSNRLKGNIPLSLCDNNFINEGRTEKFGCDAVLCSSGMFSKLGLSNNNVQCLNCPDGKTTLYLGSKECLSFSQRDVLAMFYKLMDGESWPNHLRENWLNPDVSECDWGGVMCDSDGVIESLSFPSTNYS